MSPERQDAPIFTKEGSRPFVILLVEDEVLVRFDFAEFLRAMGYSVLEATSGEEALAIFDGVDHIDLVFSDINMPGCLNGAQLAAWIGANRPLAPVILTSGVRASLEAAQRTSPNIIAVIDKPYENDSVERIIRDVLERHATR